MYYARVTARGPRPLSAVANTMLPSFLRRSDNLSWKVVKLDLTLVWCPKSFRIAF
jgi:hypothetical protein